MQLADSALPVGSAAHSFGLETLVAEELLIADSLPSFLRGYLQETGILEAAFCRAAHRLAGAGWTALNQQLSARKPAQESRAASLTLGRRFLQLFLALEGGPDPGGEAHYATAFGYAEPLAGRWGRSGRDVLPATNRKRYGLRLPAPDAAWTATRGAPAVGDQARDSRSGAGQFRCRCGNAPLSRRWSKSPPCATWTWGHGCSSVDACHTRTDACRFSLNTTLQPRARCCTSPNSASR